MQFSIWNLANAKFLMQISTVKKCDSSAFAGICCRAKFLNGLILALSKCSVAGEVPCEARVPSLRKLPGLQWCHLSTS